MDYDIVNYHHLEDAIKTLSDEEIEMIQETDLEYAVNSIKNGKSFLLAFSERHNVFGSLPKRVRVSAVIERVVFDYIKDNECRMKDFALLFKTDFPEIYKEMIMLNDIELEYYIIDSKNKHHGIIQEVIFNLINPYKLIVISEENRKESIKG